MNRMFRAFLAVSAVSALGLAAPALGQTASLVKDINPGSTYNMGSSPDEMATFRGKVLFAADEASTGRELWITDGSGSGTRLLADFYPGTGSSDPGILGTARSLLFGYAFQASSFSTPSWTYLWRSDGTREGTFLLPDPRFEVAIPFRTAPFQEEDLQGLGAAAVLAEDAVYFVGCTRDEDCSVWRTDGTAAGTKILKTFPRTAYGNRPSELTLAGGRLFFSRYQELWMSDGTPEGTVLVKELSSALPQGLTALGNKVLFLARDTGDELWVSDGTAEGTHPLTSFEPEHPFEQTRFLKTLGDKVYFVADDVTHGAELWASDGTATGTVRVTEFGFHDPFDDTDSDGLFSWEIETLGRQVIFWATDGLTGLRPWSTRGTLESTASVCPGCPFEEYGGSPLVALNGKLLFEAEDDTSRESLWVTDGTAAGTRRLTEDINVDSGLTVLPGAAFFQGTDFTIGRTALWTSDGTPQGTREFAAAEPIYHGNPLAAAALGKTVLFGATSLDDGASGAGELWASDGTPAGTRLVADIHRTGAPADVENLLAAGDRVFFTATASDSEAPRVWRSAGSAADTQALPSPADFNEPSRFITAGGKVFLIEAGFSSSNQLSVVGDDGQIQRLTSFERRGIFYAASYKGRLFFSVERGSSSSPAELWQSDGTPQGTGKAFDLPEEIEAVKFLKVAGSGLWFLANARFGAEIWYTDGTSAGTRKVLDGFRHDRTDPEFLQVGSQVYFIAVQPGGDDFDFEIWKSDGTAAGTVQVTSFSYEKDRGFPAELTAFQGNLYFFAHVPPGSRRALWRTDGTPGGTVPVKDFPLPPLAFFDEFPRYGLTSLGAWLVFSADDGVHGLEPWRSDGTPGGTTLLLDVNPGPAGSGITGFTSAGGQLYFSANDGAHGFEPWRTNGTPRDTRLVQDIAPEGASSYPAGFTAAGGRLFFSADDGLTGNELWVLPLGGPRCQPSPTALCLNGGRFKVEASWQTPAGRARQGQAVALTANAGYFWFAQATSVAAAVKVLDGRGSNGHHWVFYGALSNAEYSLTVTDTETGLAKRYYNPKGVSASTGDYHAFGPLGSYKTDLLAGAPLLVSERFEPMAATRCVPSASRLCLNNGRFAVEARWIIAGRKGTGKAVSINGETGYFWFTQATDVETVVRVQDGRPTNGRFWVLYGSLSDTEYEITVTDTVTRKVKTYKNPKGRFASGRDTGAF